MTGRHHGRLEGLLLAIAVTAAAGLALGGFWRVSEVAEHSKPEVCEAIVDVHKNSLSQVVALALALVALRRLASGGQEPPG